jgi:hypothetical protein
MPDYIEIKSNPEFMKQMLATTFPEILTSPLDFMKALSKSAPEEWLKGLGGVQIILNNKKFKTLNTAADIINQITEVGRRKSLNLTEIECSALTAFVCTKYLMHYSWFLSLKKALPHSVVTLTVKRDKAGLLVEYKQKEKNVGGYEEKNKLSQIITLYKIKCSGTLNTDGTLNSKDGNPETFFIQPGLLSKDLLAVAKSYLLDHPIPVANELYMLVPFLIDEKFRQDLHTSLMVSSAEINTLAGDLIKLYFADAEWQQKIMDQLSSVQPSAVTSVETSKSKTTLYSKVVALAEKSKDAEAAESTLPATDLVTRQPSASSPTTSEHKPPVTGQEKEDSASVNSAVLDVIAAEQRWPIDSSGFAPPVSMPTAHYVAPLAISPPPSVPAGLVESSLPSAAQAGLTAKEQKEKEALDVFASAIPLSMQADETEREETVESALLPVTTTTASTGLTSPAKELDTLTPKPFSTPVPTIFSSTADTMPPLVLDDASAVTADPGTESPQDVEEQKREETPGALSTASSGSDLLSLLEEQQVMPSSHARRELTPVLTGLEDSGVQPEATPPAANTPSPSTSTQPLIVNASMTGPPALDDDDEEGEGDAHEEVLEDEQEEDDLGEVSQVTSTGSLTVTQDNRDLSSGAATPPPTPAVSTLISPLSSPSSRTELGRDSITSSQQVSSSSLFVDPSVKEESKEGGEHERADTPPLHHIIISVAPLPTSPGTPSPVNTSGRNTRLTIMINNTLPLEVEEAEMSAEEIFDLQLRNLQKIITTKAVDDERIKSCIKLKDALNALSPVQKATDLGLLVNVLRCANTVVMNPEIASNVEIAKDLIAPLNQKRHYQIALALTAIVAGAVIVLASTAVAISSFTGVALLGLEAGISLLNQAISIAFGLIGLGVMYSGYRLFPKAPAYTAIEATREITEYAEKYRPAAMTM